MGYYIDSLDICFGTQLADSRGDIGKDNFEVVSYPTNNFYLMFSANRNLGVILYRTLRDGYMIQLC